MSKLEFLARPLVAFDATNKDHRRYYAEFIEYNGWGNCPVRFICPDDTGMDLPTMIQTRLVEYYIEREFGGTRLAKERSDTLTKAADKMYREAGRLRVEAQNLLKPRRA
jgi:hypothetical protein